MTKTPDSEQTPPTTFPEMKWEMQGKGTQEYLVTLPNIVCGTMSPYLKH